MVYFVSIPSSGTVKDGQLSPAFLRDYAAIKKLHPRASFMCPMIEDYQLLPYLDKVPTWQDFGDNCQRLIKKCDVLLVLMYPGYQQSVGVKAEIEFAHAQGLPVEFMNVDQFFGQIASDITVENWLN